jgi:hypothetical protein
VAQPAGGMVSASFPILYQERTDGANEKMPRD